ncbi:MAG TPA: hypothetical protein VHO24_11580 [Opitutaceae bacterium]|nr:hypothetical protein [Opitutaceae bacterium]
MHHSHASLAIAMIALGVSLTPPLAAQTTVETTPPSSVKIGVGMDYSKGDYGFAGDTEVYSSSLHLVYESPQWLLRAVVPYVTVKGPAVVIAGSGPVFAAPARPSRSYQRGLGDVTTSASYHLMPSTDGLNVDLTGRVKFPTSDEAKGLGTGETDFYAQTDFYRRYGNVTPFGSVGYRFLGSSPLYQLEDGFYATAGSIFRLADPTGLGVSFDWRSKIVPGGEHAFETTVFVTHNPTARWNLMGYVLKGFSDASPDIGVGGMASYRF